MTLLENLDNNTRKRRAKKPPPVFEMFNTHASREFREIAKQDLIVPIGDYQRDESEGKISSEIARHFDKVAFGVLLVIHRPNGDLVVADGGTRLSAAVQRADIDRVPCIVFSGLTDKEEADVFLRVNANRRRLQTDQQHHAELFSEHDLAVCSQNLIDRMRDRRVGFDSLSTIRSCVKRNRPAIDTVVNVLIQVAPDKYVTSRVMKALFRLEIVLEDDDRTLNKGTTISRMMTEFGQLDAIVLALAPPRQQGDTLKMAEAIARRLHIKFPRTKG